MMSYLKLRLGERSTAYGTVLSALLIVASFFVPLDQENAFAAERAREIALTMRAIAVPLFAGFFFWREDK